MARVVEVEALDGLAPDDPAALRSRRDLQRVHRAMGTRGRLVDELAALASPAPGGRPWRVLELGAGDGSLLLGVARALRERSSAGAGVELVLLDRQPLISASTIEAYAQAGWTATACVGNVEHWVAEGGANSRWDLIVTNLFLHHFSADELGTMFRAVAGRCDRFFACEPRRGWAALAGSHLVGALGANAVTRGDAVLSVRAGFTGQELSALWPQAPAVWALRESAALPFSHRFDACRMSGP